MRTMNTTTWSPLQSKGSILTLRFIRWLVLIFCFGILQLGLARMRWILDSGCEKYASDLPRQHLPLLFLFHFLDDSKRLALSMARRRPITTANIFPRPFFPSVQFLLFLSPSGSPHYTYAQNNDWSSDFSSTKLWYDYFRFSCAGEIEGMQFWEYGSGVYFFFISFLNDRILTCNLPSILTFLDLLLLMYHGPTEIAIWHDLPDCQSTTPSSEKWRKKKSNKVSEYCGEGTLLVLVSAKGLEAPLNVRAT